MGGICWLACRSKILMKVLGHPGHGNTECCIVCGGKSLQALVYDIFFMRPQRPLWM